MPFSCVKAKLELVGCAWMPAAFNWSIMRLGEAPPPTGCGSSITRTSRPLCAASSRALMTLRSLRRYISTQTDFLAPVIALVRGESPASGSTNTFTPCAPDPIGPLLVVPPVLPPPLLPPPREILASHAVRNRQRRLRMIAIYCVFCMMSFMNIMTSLYV